MTREETTKAVEELIEEFRQIFESYPFVYTNESLIECAIVSVRRELSTIRHFAKYAMEECDESRLESNILLNVKYVKDKTAILEILKSKLS